MNRKKAEKNPWEELSDDVGDLAKWDMHDLAAFVYNGEVEKAREMFDAILTKLREFQARLEGIAHSQKLT